MPRSVSLCGFFAFMRQRNERSCCSYNKVQGGGWSAVWGGMRCAVVCLLIGSGVFEISGWVHAQSDGWVRVPASSYTGIPISETDIEPLSIGDFELARTEVTGAQWTEVVDWARSRTYVIGEIDVPSDASLPVSKVAYIDAIVWLNAHSERAGKDPVYRDARGAVIRDRADVHAHVLAGAYDGYRLPTATEWTVAARVLGTTMPQHDAPFTETLGNLTHYYHIDARGVTTQMFAVQEQQGPVYWAPLYGERAVKQTSSKNAFGLIGMDSSVRELVVNEKLQPGYVADAHNFAVAVEDCACSPSVGDARIGFRPARSVVSDRTHIALPTPHAGVEAVTTLDAATYTAVVSWSPALIDQKFAPNVAYTARIALTAKPPYTVRGAQVRVPRARTVSIADEVVTAEFHKTAPRTVQMVDIPTRGIKNVPTNVGTYEGRAAPMPFSIGSTEVTRGMWNDVASWAVAQGYRFAARADPFWNAAPDLPYIVRAKNDLFVWLNAKSAQEGRDPAYRDAQGRIVTDAAKNVPIDVVQAMAYNGYRLPSEQELIVAGALLPDGESKSWEKNAFGTTKVGKKVTNWDLGYTYFEKAQCIKECYGFGGAGDVVVPWTKREGILHKVPMVVSGLGTNAQEWYVKPDHRTIAGMGAFRVAQSTIRSAQDVAMPLTAPVVGEKPQTRVDTSAYTGTVSWTPAVQNGRFAAKTKYTATVTLRGRPNYVVDRITVPSALSVRLDTKSSIASIAFASTQTVVQRVDVLVRAGALTKLPHGPKGTKPIRVKNFYASNTEVTYRLWWDVMQWGKKNGYTFVGSGMEGSRGVVGAAPTERQFEPVVNMNKADVFVWLNAKSEKSGLRPVYTDRTGRVMRNAATDAALLDDSVLVQSLRAQTARNGYRIPLHDEWRVMAAIAGTTRDANIRSIATKEGKIKHYWFDVWSAPVPKRFAWYGGVRHTQPVGQKQPSPIGIYDAFGNVQEWVFFPEGLKHPIFDSVSYVGGVGGDIFSSKPSLYTCGSLDGCSQQVVGLRIVRTQ
jgi:formylglycine-generating enzyme required for sulfatase activity